MSELASSSPLGLLALELLARLRRLKDGGLVFIASDEARAERLGAILHAFDPACGVMVLPRLDTLPVDELEPSRDVLGRRHNVLRRLAEHQSPYLLIASIDATLPRVPAAELVTRSSLRLAPGQSFDPEEFAKKLEAVGYELDEAADYPGCALFHGQAVEIFPAGGLQPVRIEHTDGVVSGISWFNRTNPSDTAPCDHLVLDPIIMHGAAQSGDDRSPRAETTDLFAYLPSATLIVDRDVSSRAEARLAAIAAGSEGQRKDAFISKEWWSNAMQGALALGRTSPVETIPQFAQQPSAAAALRAFIDRCRAEGAQIILTAGSKSDLRRVQKMGRVEASLAADWAAASRTGGGSIASLLVDLEAGFKYGGRKPVYVITAADVLGSRARHLQPMAVQTATSDGAARLVPGGAVVHLQRGLAILGGLERVSSPGVSDREMMRLTFAGDESMLLPLAELALIWPYATDPSGVSLDDADGTSWATRRDAAWSEIDRTAQQLSCALAERRQMPAPRIVPPAAEYERFVGRFPYFATPDQVGAVEDVLRDLAAGHPMDRIICGDVGFGKTEVALRACAAAVLSGKQVAVVVPTTVLARQHLQSFDKRFAPLGISVCQLSRLTSAREARAVKQQLKDGSCRVVIGTHALAQQDVAFADLGLVIIDEEQHFGASDKAKLGALREGVHTLTMSATPIPRTMAAALAGLRDMSIIATPPVQRIPVVTKVMSMLDATIATALRREHRRRGQSFVICPRIKDLEPMRQRLQQNVPELRVITLHGRLPAADIDERMMQFMAGEADVLLATDIIENGLDIPRANTILICAPERFGLAQLHQLRGRVGRSSIRAYAYLLTEKTGEAADKRIAALEELSRPGAGFQISARDLDLRGAGDLLSEQQAGHVQVLGPALYQHLLARAVQGKPQRIAEIWAPKLNIEVSALIPEDYISDEATRLDLHTRLARAERTNDIEDLEDEIEHRFGVLPVEVSNLIACAEISFDCQSLGLAQVSAGPAGVSVELRPNAAIGPLPAPIRRKADTLVLKTKIEPGDQIATVRMLLDRLSRSRTKPNTKKTMGRR